MNVDPEKDSDKVDELFETSLEFGFDWDDDGNTSSYSAATISHSASTISRQPGKSGT